MNKCAAAVMLATWLVAVTALAQPAKNNSDAHYENGQFRLPPLLSPKDAYTILIDEGKPLPRRLNLPEGVHGLSILPSALPPGALIWNLAVTRAMLPAVDVTTARDQKLRAQDLDEGRVVVGWKAVQGAEKYRIAGKVVDQERAGDDTAWTKLSVECILSTCTGYGFQLKPGQQAKYTVAALDKNDVPIAESAEMEASVEPGLARQASTAGLKIQRSDTLNKAVMQEGALFSWAATEKGISKRSAAYRSEFALIWEPPGKSYYGWFPRVSLEAALTSSGEQKGSDALKFRVGGYNIWQPQAGKGAELTGNLKYETERKTGTKKALVELAATPVFGWLGQYNEIGPARPRNAIGNFATPPLLVIAPVATFAAEIGKTLDLGTSNEKRDTVVRFRSTLRLDMEFPQAAAGLQLPRVAASLQATHWRLPREADNGHSLGRASLIFGLTPEVSLEISHSVGRDAPVFTFSRVTSGGLGIKF